MRAHQAHSHKSTTPSVTTTRAATHHLLPSLQNAAAASLSSLLLLTAQPCAAQEELSIAFPASGRPDIRAAQKTLVEAWAYTDTLYVDPPPHEEWAKALQEALGASFKAKDAEEVTQLTRDLLAKLDDSYTRLLSDKEKDALAAEEEGKIEPTQWGIIDLSKAASSDSPVVAAATLTPGSSSSSSSGNFNSSSSSTTSSATNRGRVGYLKLITFSSNAPQAVADALINMQREVQPGGQLSGVIVDLRDNTGGIVEAGVAIAQEFLRAGDVLCIAVDKTGQEERVVLPEAYTLTDLPLVVLVNQSTASTSELLAGALRDSLNVPLIGTHTFGKGRTQRLIKLANAEGGVLLVSDLKYFTPRHTPIDNVGLEPDVVCKPDEVVQQKWVAGRVGGDVGSLLSDPCIKLAAERLSGSTTA